MDLPDVVPLVSSPATHPHVKAPRSKQTTPRTSRRRIRRPYRFGIDQTAPPHLRVWNTSGVPASDEWVELFTIERRSEGPDDRQAMATQLAVRGFDMDRGVDPADVRVDLICGRDAELHSWLRVSVRRSVYDQIGPVVIRLPLEELLEPGHTQPLSRQRYLSTDDVKGFLRISSVRFVVANVGHSLAWVDVSRTFDVWKSEVQPYLADPESPFHLDDFPGEYAYLASQWATADGDDDTIVLLEKHH